MGWGPARSIFNSVAAALIEADADDATITHVLGALIEELNAEDWDTQRESLERFRHYPPVVKAFRLHRIELPY